MLVLTRNDVRQLVPMTDAIELMKLAFRELSAGRAESPLRSVVPVAEGAVTLLMPAYVPAANALGFKVVSVFEGNRDKDLPTISAMVCLLDESTGAPMAIISGAYLTALRTGAVSGAATDLLARDDARNLVVIGAGAQGVTQAAAVAAVRPIEKITGLTFRKTRWNDTGGRSPRTGPSCWIGWKRALMRALWRRLT
jgi:ornithine cyclodeaminase/alanine dehydrogenase-like protein (mu-crystallin family)